MVAAAAGTRIDQAFIGSCANGTIDDIYTEPAEAFLLYLKIAALVGAIMAAPVILWQFWLFVAPGLYAHEKRLVLPLVAASSVLFLVGMAFAYFLVFPVVFQFMASIAPEGAGGPMIGSTGVPGASRSITFTPVADASTSSQTDAPDVPTGAPSGP